MIRYFCITLGLVLMFSSQGLSQHQSDYLKSDLANAKRILAQEQEASQSWHEELRRAYAREPGPGRDADIQYHKMMFEKSDQRANEARNRINNIENEIRQQRLAQQSEQSRLRLEENNKRIDETINRAKEALNNRQTESRGNRTSVRTYQSVDAQPVNPSTGLVSIAKLEQRVRELSRQLDQARAGEWVEELEQHGAISHTRRERRVDHDKVARLEQSLREAEIQLAAARAQSVNGGGGSQTSPGNLGQPMPGLGREQSRYAETMAKIGQYQSLNPATPDFDVSAPDVRPQILYTLPPPPGWNENRPVPWTFPPQPWAAWPVTDADGKVWALDGDGFYEEFDDIGAYERFMAEEKVKRPDPFAGMPPIDEDPASPDMPWGYSEDALFSSYTLQSIQDERDAEQRIADQEDNAAWLKKYKQDETNALLLRRNAANRGMTLNEYEAAMIKGEGGAGVDMAISKITTTIRETGALDVEKRMLKSSLELRDDLGMLAGDDTRAGLEPPSAAQGND